MAEDRSVTYSELCKGYRAIRDFRAKLLGLLPLASGGGIALLLSGKMSVHFIALGTVGAVVTAGLLLYEVHNMRKCHKLICEGARLEEVLGGGQFRVHPVFVSEDCKAKHLPPGLHLFAALLVYLSVIAGWLYVVAVGLCFVEVHCVLPCLFAFR